ncbi:MAG: ribonuclease H-like domain-containing protein [archaeon]|nr:MAG: ribonuclease H-like domain-containing protein [archaeon]
MKIKFLLLDAEYTENDKIRLFGKDEKGKPVFVLVDFDPYLYALPKKITKKIKDKILALEEVKKIETAERILGSGKEKILKIYAKKHADIPKIRDEIKDFPEIGHDGCYEYAINFYRRYLIDNQFSPGDWFEADLEGGKAKKIKKTKPGKTRLKEIAFDIETYEEGDETRIVMISFFGKNFKKVLTYKKGSYPKYVSVVKNEKQLLQNFVQVIKEKNPDIIYGYNSDEFDFKLIQERAEEKKVKLDIGRDGSEVKFTRRARISSAEVQGRVHVDIFNFISNIISPQLQTEVLGLGEVSSEILGDSKMEMQLEEIYECWRKDVNKLAEYCLKDSELAFRLGEFFLPQVLELCKLIGQTPFDVSRMMYSQMVEWYLSRRAFEMNRIIPNQPKFDEIRRRRMRGPYTGGFVKEPIEGLHKNIAVLDFRSLYPTIIASHNISPETLDCPCCKGERVPGLNHHFCKNKKGFVSTIIKEIVKERIEIKKKLKKKFDEGLSLQEKALKITANATYGYFAFPGSKWYCYECAQSSAAWGRFYIKKIIHEAEGQGFRVIYSDTDSVFLTSEKIKQKTKKFLSKINKSLPGIMELDLQDFYKRGLFVSTKVGRGAKKRYALVDEKGELTIRGFETVRRDWCNLAKEVQRKVLRLVLEKNKTEEAINYVRKVVEKIKNGKVDIKDLVIHEQLTKRLKDYEQIGPHVVAAYKMKHRGESVGPGMVIMFVIGKGSGSISQRAEPIQNMKIEKVDNDYYINNQIVPVAMRVLGVLGITESELKGEGKQTGLKKFGV